MDNQNINQNLESTTDDQDENIDQPLTKKERKEIRRSEKEFERTKMKRGRSARRVGIWLTTFVVIGVALYGLSQIGGNNHEGSLDKNNYDNDWTKGLSGASVTLVEYGDFQCPACGSYYPLLKQLESEFGDRVLFVYRHFPLQRIHPFAELAAQASEAAGAQGKFWEMHDLIFENQGTWSRGGAQEAFLSYAKDLELDLNQFQVDIESNVISDAVASDYNSGTKAGVDSTPSFYINGEKIINPNSYEDFSNIIQSALEAAALKTEIDDNS